MDKIKNNFGAIVFSINFGMIAMLALVIFWHFDVLSWAIGISFTLFIIAMFAFFIGIKFSRRKSLFHKIGLSSSYFLFYSFLLGLLTPRAYIVRQNPMIIFIYIGVAVFIAISSTSIYIDELKKAAGKKEKKVREKWTKKEKLTAVGGVTGFCVAIFAMVAIAYAFPPNLQYYHRGRDNRVEYISDYNNYTISTSVTIADDTVYFEIEKVIDGAPITLERTISKLEAFENNLIRHCNDIHRRRMLGRREYRINRRNILAFSRTESLTEL